VCSSGLVVFLLTFCRINNRDWSKEVLRESTAQEVAIVEAMSVDDPPRDIAMLNESSQWPRGT